MSKSIVVEVGGQAVAVAAPVQGGYKFVAVKFDVWSLDGRVFPSVLAAERAAAQVLAGGPVAVPKAGAAQSVPSFDGQMDRRVAAPV
jgi:hypothetical protein